MKLTENGLAVFNFVKENGKVSIDEIATGLGKSVRSVNGTVTALGTKGPHAKGLVERIKEDVEGEEKPVTFVALTEKGEAFDPDAEDED